MFVPARQLPFTFPAGGHNTSQSLENRSRVSHIFVHKPVRSRNVGGIELSFMLSGLSFFLWNKFLFPQRACLHESDRLIPQTFSFEKHSELHNQFRFERNRRNCFRLNVGQRRVDLVHNFFGVA